MRLITTLCPEDTFKFSHVHKYIYSKFSRGSSIKPAEVCCVLKFGTRRCKENIPAEGCHVPGHLFRKPSNWHSQWTPGDQRKNERFHWSPSAWFFFSFLCSLWLCNENLGGKKEKNPIDSYKLATISLWNLQLLAVRAKSQSTLSAVTNNTLLSSSTSLEQAFRDLQLFAFVIRRED